MKKILLAILSIGIINATAQDNKTSLKDLSDKDPLTVTKKLSIRCFAGPELAFLYKGDYSEMKGGSIGLNAGLELNKSFSKRVYGIIGLGVASGGMERWVNNEPGINSRNAYDQLTALEIPIGVGFNYGKNSPRGFFTNFTFINSIGLKSRTSYTVNPFGNFLASANVIDKTYETYNVGGRMEFGLKTKFEGNSYASFSLSGKGMMYNGLSSSARQFIGLHVAALMGFYF